MLKKCLSLLLTGLLIVTTSARPVLAHTQASKQTPSVADVKIKIIRLGIGERARATVRLKDGTKVKGYIAQAGENDFTIRDRKTDVPTIVSYGDVVKIERNKGHSTARAIAIGAGVAAGAFLALLGITFAVIDD